VGKSTFFIALTKKINTQASNFPFCTIDPNEGIVEVIDPRIDALATLSHSLKKIYATTTFVDIAGLVKGASKGEGLGNKFLSNIRETDLIIHLVRCFEEENVIHVEGKVDPIHDIEVINLELILSDLQSVEKIIEKVKKKEKSQKGSSESLAILEKVKKHLDHNQPVRTLSLTKEEKELLKPYPLLTQKPVLYVANVGEDDLPSMENGHVEKVRAFAEKEGSHTIPICAKIEEELASLSEEEAKEYLETIGLKEKGLDRLITTAFNELGLITFITTGKEETRAWPITKGTKAPAAAGKIHSDIEKGFIRAEVVSYDNMITYQGRTGAKAAGKAPSEGKEYIVQDGM